MFIGHYGVVTKVVESIIRRLMKLSLLAIILISLFISISCEKVEISEAEAESLASLRFNDFVKGKNIPPSQFELTQIDFNPGANAWLVTFESKDEPHRTIFVTVDRYGRGSELSGDMP
jgi:hypothetical protein